MISASIAEPEVALRLRGITKRFGPLTANDNIGFDIDRGEVVALLGENGAGKTTLMNILFGHYVADAGEAWAFGKLLPPGSPRAAIEAGIGMVHQHFALADNLTVLENVMLGTESLLGVTRSTVAARQKLLELSEAFGLKVAPLARVGDLSVGERQRVEILKVLYRDAKILILDEPTAVLTPQESAALFETLRKLVARGLSIIFISHKLNEVLAVSDRVVVLRSGKVVGERASRGATREELAELMVGRPIPKPSVAPREPGAARFEMKDVVVRGTHAQAILDQANLVVHGGEIVGIAGVSGNGQSALADLLSGLVAPSGGECRVLGTAIARASPRDVIARGVGRIPEDRHAIGVIGDLSVMENVIAERCHDQPFSRRGLIDWSAARLFTEKIIHDFDVKCPSALARTRLLSGGNMQKLVLGRVLSFEPKLVLANQPTRGLDISAVAYVHERLLEVRGQGGAVLLISDDLDEILSLSDRIAVMYRGRISASMRRDEVTVQQLGLMMAGHGMEARVHAA